MSNIRFSVLWVEVCPNDQNKCCQLEGTMTRLEGVDNNGSKVYIARDDYRQWQMLTIVACIHFMIMAENDPSIV